MIFVVVKIVSITSFCQGAEQYWQDYFLDIANRFGVHDLESKDSCSLHTAPVSEELTTMYLMYQLPQKIGCCILQQCQYTLVILLINLERVESISWIRLETTKRHFWYHLISWCDPAPKAAEWTTQDFFLVKTIELNPFCFSSREGWMWTGDRLQSFNVPPRHFWKSRRQQDQS